MPNLRGRFFHPNLDRNEAIRILMNAGLDGSFLVRPSKTNKSANVAHEYTLSVKRNGEVTHIKIQNSDEFYDFYGGEKFATLAELVEYYMENHEKMKERNGEIIELKYPILCEDPTNERWFHGPLTSNEAENLMMERGKNGSYLVRQSQSKPGDFVFTVRTDDKVTHVIIRSLNGLYDVGGGQSFATLTELVEHYKRMPMVEVSGTVVHLRIPFNATKIIASTIENRVKMLSMENNFKTGFWEEFEYLQQQECKPSPSRRDGQKIENRPKNRYKNILPFDYNRVILKSAELNVLGSDYINANHIHFEMSNKKYIATQGPLANTRSDFWSMVWHENCYVIVNTTKEMERGKNKCVRYWPDCEKSCKYGHVTVHTLSEKQTSNFTLREFELQHDAEEDEQQQQRRSVYHFHFTAWPDHGVPSDPSCVLGFLHEVNAKQESLELRGPVIVHCSAGIGRTGTFIVIDLLLDQIKREGVNCEIDIQRTILELRAQRSGMVQTEAQYKFVYLAVQQFVRCQDPKYHAELLKMLKAGSEYTNLKNIPELRQFCDFASAAAVTTAATTTADGFLGATSSRNAPPEAVALGGETTMPATTARMSPLPSMLPPPPPLPSRTSRKVP